MLQEQILIDKQTELMKNMALRKQPIVFHGIKQDVRKGTKKYFKKSKQDTRKFSTSY